MQFLRLAGQFFALFLVAAMPHAASAQRILTYTDHEPLGGMRTRFIKDVFFAAIEKESDGRIMIKDHWDGALAISYDALRVVSEGRAADMGVVVPEYTPNDLPLSQIFKGFPVGPTGDRQVAFFRRVYREVPAFAAELEKKNLVPVFFATGYPVAFFSTKPLNSLADMAGQTWRTASFWHRDFLRNAGSRPVSIPWGEEVYKALQARTLDGLMVNVDSGYMLKVPETAPNVLASRDLWLGHLYIVAMNKTTWDSLAREDKEAIQRAAEIAYRTLGKVMDESFDVMIRDMRREGANVRVVGKDEATAFAKATRYEDAQEAWAKEQDAKGVKDAAKVATKVRAMLNGAVN